MASTERLKDFRALPDSTDRPTRILQLMSNSNDDRERPTDPVSHAPPSAPTASFHAMPPEARVPTLPDPNSWSDQVMQAILDGMAELKIARAAFDADALLSRQTEVFASIVTDRYEMIRGPIVAFGAKLDDLVSRVDKHDDRLDDGAQHFEKLDDRIERLELEMAAMRTQLERLESMLAVMKKEGSNDVTQATTTPEREAPSDPG